MLLRPGSPVTGADGRWLRVTTAIGARAGADATPATLCSVCVDLLGLTGAGITLMGDDPLGAGTFASDPVTKKLEELQFTLGDGPCRDAYESGIPVMEADLAALPTTRWMAYTGQAVEAGARAVFSFPMRIGAARVGALTLYRDRAGPLSAESHADALVLAEVTTRTMLAMQAHTPVGELAAELSLEGSYHAEVHQAAGMVSVQLDIGIGEALTRIRARAFSTHRTVTDVAADVVARRLRFSDEAG